jgi:hypothetical protein
MKKECKAFKCKGYFNKSDAPENAWLGEEMKS